MALDGVFAGIVGCHGYLVAAVAEGGKGDAVAGDGIEYLARDGLRAGRGGKEQRTGHEEENDK